MSQNNLSALAKLTRLAVSIDLENTPIPVSQGQHFPLSLSGVVVGKSFAADLVKQKVDMDDHARLDIVASLFDQLDLSKIDTSVDILTIKAGEQVISVDLSYHNGKVRVAQRAAKIASIKERVSCDLLDFDEQKDKVIIIGYSPVALKTEYEVLREPIENVPALITRLAAAAFDKGDIDKIGELNGLKTKSSEFFFKLTLELS